MISVAISLHVQLYSGAARGTEGFWRWNSTEAAAKKGGVPGMPVIVHDWKREKNRSVIPS